MSSLPVICVTIPTYNCAAELDVTVQSVLSQEYDEEKIIILFVDFGSTDGTQEKILAYRREWTGVFSLAGRRIGRTMTADAFSMWKYQGIPGYPSGYKFLLRPGDTTYPRCFRICAGWFNWARQQKLHVSHLMGEADIREADGVVRRQTPVFTKPCLLRAYSEDSYEYVKKGYKHMVLPFGMEYSGYSDKVGTLINLDLLWNRFACRGFASNVIYINEPLGCLKIREPDDELDDILFAFEQALTMFRMTGELPEQHVTNKRFEPECRARLAQFALWRAFVLHERGRSKEAEDCFLLSRIINPVVVKEEYWQYAERLIEQHDSASGKWLEEYFSREEPPDNPKWPLDLMSRLWRRIRQLFSREKTSRFYYQ